MSARTSTDQLFDDFRPGPFETLDRPALVSPLSLRPARERGRVAADAHLARLGQKADGKGGDRETE